jgi:hypothetical protein
MKNLILIVSLFCITSVFSQKEIDRTIDWQNLNEINKTKLLEPVKNQKFAVFKIKDINKFLYQVTITGVNVKIETEMSNELKLLFRISDSQQKEITNNDKASKAVEDSNIGLAMMEKLAEVLSKNKAADNEGNDSKNDKIEQDLKDLIKECNKYIIELDKVKNDLSLLKYRKIDLINHAKKDISFDSMKKVVGSLTTSIPKDTYEKMESIYTKVLKRYQTAKEDAIGDKMKNTISDALKLIKDAYEEIESEEFMNLYRDVTYLEAELTNPANFYIIAPPVQAKDDLINFKVSATPITTNSLAPFTSKTEFSFDIPVKGGVKVDFSVGPTLSFGNGAKDELFYLEESTTSGKSYLRQRDNNNASLPGLAAMMHFYDRGVKETKVGGLFGVGAGFQSIDDVDLSFYLGASVILGKTQKIMINTGLSFLRVDRLKEKQYELGKEYTTQDFVINDVVEKVFKPSFFIGLSYSLAKRVDN